MFLRFSLLAHSTVNPGSRRGARSAGGLLGGLTLLLCSACTAVEAVNESDDQPAQSDAAAGTPSCQAAPTQASSDATDGDASEGEGDATADEQDEATTQDPVDATAAPATNEQDAGRTAVEGSSEPTSDAGENETFASDSSEADAEGAEAGSPEPQPETDETAGGSGDASAPPCAQLCTQITQLQSEGNQHVDTDAVVEYGHNPPASGPHFPIWAKYGAYDVVVPRGYWVHALEHGSVVFLYGPGASEAQIAELRAAYDALPNDEACGIKRAILTPDPELDDALAVVAWTWVLETSCPDRNAMLEFASEHRGQGIEHVCGDGSFEP